MTFFISTITSDVCVYGLGVCSDRLRASQIVLYQYRRTQARIHRRAYITQGLIIFKNLSSSRGCGYL